MREELRGRLGRMPHAVLRLAIRRLPTEVRQSAENEWQAELHHILRRTEGLPVTRLVSGVLYALGLLRTARRIGRELRTVRNSHVPAPQRSASSLPPFRRIALAGGMVASITTASVATTMIGGVVSQYGAPTFSYSEQVNSSSPRPTFRDPRAFTGQGPSVQPGRRVEVVCRLFDPNAPASVQPGWWYRIASAPWNGQYYTVANSYLNGDPPEGPHLTEVDSGVPVC